MQAWRLALAILVVVGLGVGLVYVVLADGEVGGSAPTLASALPRGSGPGSGVTVTLRPPDSPVARPVTTSTTTPSRTTSTAATTPPVVTALREALSAWGEFAVTGRIRDLGGHFVAGGPQRRRLRAEAESIRADPSGAPPYLVTTGEMFTVSVTPTDVVLRTEIEWARQGEATQFFVWDIQMQLADGKWRLLTVDEVGEGGEG